MTCFLGLELLVRFEKHPKAVSGALRDRFRAREVFGSFEKRTPVLPISNNLRVKIYMCELIDRIDRWYMAVSHFCEHSGDFVAVSVSHRVLLRKFLPLCLGV